MDAPHLRRWIGRRLLAWFADHRRSLPWRASRDAYRVWVSEVMLQQTVVGTVAPRFERFVARYPTLAALAMADEQDVLRLWEGLGYYRRARNLLCAARTLNERHGGTFPSTEAELQDVPGMGRYTRNAVLSQAFGVRLPIVEANSRRVLARLFGEAAPSERWLWAAAEAVLPARDVGDYNQAMMELGSLVCTPASPKCGECPLSARCEAFRLGRQDEIPVKPPRKPPRPVNEVAVVVWREGRVLLVQRPPAGRWANLWEFPHGERLPGESATATAFRLASEAGLHVEVGQEVMTIRHGVTRYAITMACLEARWLAGEFVPGAHIARRWVRPSELPSMATSSPQRRLMAAVTPSGSG